VEERRATSRYNLALPVEISLALIPIAVRSIFVQTRDISTRGFYFNIAQKVTVGAKFDFSILFRLKSQDPLRRISAGQHERFESRKLAKVTRAGWASLPSLRATKCAEEGFRRHGKYLCISLHTIGNRFATLPISSFGRQWSNARYPMFWQAIAQTARLWLLNCGSQDCGLQPATEPSAPTDGTLWGCPEPPSSPSTPCASSYDC
jgi:hypothetical protein